MKLRFFFITLLLFTLQTLSFSQEEEEDPSIQLSPQLDMIMRVPQTPEAAAFVKYGNIPVNMYTGTPNISVPLHTLQGREFSLPIALSYDASGIKVDQIATWVGLGWNLNAGGAITRQVQGIPDGYGLYGKIYDPEIQDFIQYASQNNMSMGTIHPTARHRKYFEITRELANGQVDLQPDLFPFSIHGLSGTLFIDYKQKTAYCMEHPNLKVELGLFLGDSNPVTQLRSWKLTAEDGTQYLFEKQEITNHRGQAGPRHPGFSYRYVSAWYISKIISPNQRDVIEFTYSSTSPWVNKQDITHTFSGVSVVNRETNSSECGGNSSPIQFLPGPSDASYWAEQPYLESIRINGYKRAVFYKSSTDRKDLKGRKRLIAANFYDPLGRSLISHVKLTNGNPDGRDPGFYFGNPQSFDEKQMRLMLKGVEFYGDLASSNKPQQSYSFEYFEPRKVPKRGSFAADMAGYYNGQVQNPSLIPQYVENGVNLYPGGANRKPNLTACKVGTLKKITYPTGGETNFDYGLHHLPANENQTSEVVKKSLLDLSGGADEGRNPYKFEYGCFEEEPTTDPIPKGRANSFSNNPNNTDFKPLKLNISVEGRINSDDFMYLVIYKSGECLRAGSGECASKRYLFCDIYNLVVSCRADEENCPVDIVFSGDPRRFSAQDREILFENLESGGYQILAFNGDPQATLKIELTALEHSTEQRNEVEGGLRVVELIDKADAASAATHTYYIYQDFAGWSSQFSPTLAKNTFYTSSGKRQFNPAYTSFQTSTYCVPADPTPFDGSETEVTCTRTSIFSNRIFPGSGHIGYSAVTELQYDPSTKEINGFTVHGFHNEDASLNKIPGIQANLSARLNGRPSQTKVYNKNRQLLSKQTQRFKVEGIPGQASSRGLHLESSHTLTGLRMLTKAPNTPQSSTLSYLSFTTFCRGRSDLTQVPPECEKALECLPGSFPINQQLTHFTYNSFWIQNTQSLQSQYYLEGGTEREVLTKTEFHYDNPLHKQLTRSMVTTSDGSTRETRMYYPDDNLKAVYYRTPTGSKRLFNDSEVSSIQKLSRTGKYHLNEVVATQQLYNGDTPIFIEKRNYQDFGSRVVPVAIENSNGQSELTTVANLSYLNSGLSLAEVRRPNGPPQVMLYAYNYTLPVMSLVGVPLGGRAQNGLLSRYTGINNLGRLTRSSQIASELVKIREKAPEALITDYTYNLKLQLTGTTSPEGLRTFYTYDMLGRLIQSQNDDKHLLQQIEYNQVQP